MRGKVSQSFSLFWFLIKAEQQLQLTRDQDPSLHQCSDTSWQMLQYYLYSLGPNTTTQANF